MSTQFIPYTAVCDTFSWTDDFNRADGGIGSDWDLSVSNGIIISSNAAKLDVGSGVLASVSTGIHTFPNNQYVQARSVSWNANVHGLFVRGGTTNVRWSQFATYRVYNAVAAFDTGITPVLGDTVYFSAVGSALTLKVNGATVWTGTEDVPTSGQPGFLFSYQGALLLSTKMDDFECGGIC